MRWMIVALLAASLPMTAQARNQNGSNHNTAVAGAAASSTAVAGAAAFNKTSVSVRNSNHNTNFNSNYAKQGQDQGQTLNYSSKEERQAPAVSAPSLAVSQEACMGSSAAGASVAGFGASFGSSWVSEQCERRMNAQQLRLAGRDKAALALLCQNPGVREAMSLAGTPCPGEEAKPTSAVPVAAPAVASGRHPGCTGSLVNKQGDWYKQNCT